MRDRPAFDLFLISWLVLFLELACIRWFPSHVLFLTFFTNTVLLACFVGMSIGCLVARRPGRLLNSTPAWLFIAVLGGVVTDQCSGSLLPLFAVGNQANPEVVYFGTEYSAITEQKFTIPIEVVGALFFVLIAAVMVGPGQEMGRAFNRTTNRTTAYSANLLGSIVGIGMFALCSYLGLPPIIWFALIVAVLAYLLLRPDPNPESANPVVAAVPPPETVAGGADSPKAARSVPLSANLLACMVGVAALAGYLYSQLPPSLPEDSASVKLWRIVWRVLAVALSAFVAIRAAMHSESAVATKTENQSEIAAPLFLFFLAATVGMTGFTSGFFRGDFDKFTTWSPYYRIDYLPDTKYINTNLISQQVMEPIDSSAVAPYALPYLFQRDLKKPNGQPEWPAFKRVLIIGAGSGNDVARACRWLPPDAVIDAVEIDPVIQKIGSSQHPNQPFQDKRVKVHLNDGRNFLRMAEPETYDLVVFALIDSLVLQSGYSNLRLESYLFTRESFADVRRALKPTGVYSVYNFFRQGWIPCRINDQLRTAFGSNPVVMTSSPFDPPLTKITQDAFEPYQSTIFFAGTPEVLDPIRKSLENTAARYWYPWGTGTGTEAARFGEKPPDVQLAQTGRPFLDGYGKVKAPVWYGLRIAEVEEPGRLRQATDDWPFLYTKVPAIPEMTWRNIGLTLVLSVLLWFAFGGNKALGVTDGGSSGSSATKPDWGPMLRSACLGAGFMLVETKAVVQMALLFGGTWMVNTVVFAAILLMSLAGNYYAGRVNPKRLEPYYIGLFVALAIGVAIAPSVFLGMNPTLQIIGVCILVFAPIAFASVIFATTFKRTAQPDRVFGANVAGALIGGLAENTSVLLGFQLLLCVAVGFYLLSAVFGNQKVPDLAAKQSV